ncbi:adenosyl-chloride synthase [bacterium BMS3Abin07]|nr:adenosyl-chloride synthase [bacterium BMS3Abin07]GBE31986.1 adenosyl-chloride synthase [bacterium BMS3Bbin05]HDO21750.1 hypothetical protein [Nitrospirota bacterium]HDZ88501.1 hypothetical protein [Nitrospirota bacterium]
MKRTITLLTDFGARDTFAGQMKGVIYSINDEVNIVDITHDIQPHMIREAAIALGMCYEYFPRLTVHVCVIDPGVGSERRPIIVASGNYYFIGPDNGIFSYIYNINKEITVIHIKAEHYFLRKGSSTFQARDIFAPVAAWLTKGVEITKFGDEISDYVKLELPVPRRKAKNIIEGEIVHIDRFGNALTNVSAKDFSALSVSELIPKCRVICKGRQVRLKHSYSDVTNKELYAVFNSNDLLELFIYRGNAASQFGLKTGDIVSLILQE